MVHDEIGDSEHQPIVGLVSETDLVRKVMASDSFDLSTSVGQFMGNELQRISANRLMLDASGLMTEKGNVEKTRQRRSHHFAVLTYSMYAPRVKQ